MYGIFTYIHHKNQLNVGKYTSPMDPIDNWGSFQSGLHGQEPTEADLATSEQLKQVDLSNDLGDVSKTRGFFHEDL